MKTGWARSMKMISNNLKMPARAERFIIKHNIIKSLTEFEENEIKDSWMVKTSFSETRYIRQYASHDNKSAKGAGNSVFKMLKDEFLVFPIMESETNGIIIKCKANKIRDIINFKINFWIKITEKGNKFIVEYFFPFNVGLEMTKGMYDILSVNATSVISGETSILASVMSIQLPKKIDDSIKGYLNT